MPGYGQASKSDFDSPVLIGKTKIIFTLCEYLIKCRKFLFPKQLWAQNLRHSYCFFYPFWGVHRAIRR